MSKLPVISGLEQLATRLLAGELSMEEFVQRAGKPGLADVGHAQVDLDRDRRCGFPEVVFAQGKSVETLEKIFSALTAHGADVLATRMSPEQAEAVQKRFPTGRYNPVGRTFRIPKGVIHEEEGQAFTANRSSTSFNPEPTATAFGRPKHRRRWLRVKRRSGIAVNGYEESKGEAAGKVTIVTAGTTDLPVAEEARETALWTGADVTLIQDVGVAGPHRLTANLPLLREADAVVVVAGMEGALPSVVGGHVACPVIAVPTSVGYGASFGGIAALLGMLNSCAANVTVVNIDAGFKGGYVAGLIARNVARARNKTT